MILSTRILILRLSFLASLQDEPSPPGASVATTKAKVTIIVNRAKKVFKDDVLDGSSR